MEAGLASGEAGCFIGVGGMGEGRRIQKKKNHP